MNERALSVALCGLMAACVGALVPNRSVLVPAVATLAILALLVLLRASAALLGYTVFVSTLLTRLRAPVIPLLPEHITLLLAIGALLARGRADLLVRAARLLPLPAWGFVLWGAAASLFFSPDPSASLRIVGWIASSMLGASLVAVLCASQRRPLAAVVARLVSLVGVGASVGVFAWLVASAIPGLRLGVQTESLTGAPAAYGVSLEANIFGGICAVWLVIDVLYVHRSRIAATTIIRGLLGAGVLVSLTRAAALGAVIGIGIGAVATPRTRRVGTTVIVVIALGGGGLLLVGPTVPMLAPLAEKGGQLLDFDSSTTVVRRETWELARDDMSLVDVLVGQGVNSFGQRHEDPSRPSEGVPGYLGNVFLQVIYDTGLVGLALLGAAIVVIAQRQRSRDARMLGLLACGAVVGAATSPLWFANWWVVASVAAVAARDRRRFSPALPAPLSAARNPVGALTVSP